MLMSQSHGRGATHIPDGGSFYDFSGASNTDNVTDAGAQVTVGIDSLFDISKQAMPYDPMLGSALSRDAISLRAKDRAFVPSSGRAQGERNDSNAVGAVPPFLTSSALLDFSATSASAAEAKSLKIDAETGESIVLSSSAASLPHSWSPKRGPDERKGEGLRAGSRLAPGHDGGQAQKQHLGTQSVMSSMERVPSMSSSSSLYRPRPATTLLSGGSSLGMSAFFSQQSSKTQGSQAPPHLGKLRAQTAGPATRSTGFLRGPDARRKMASRARHVSMGQLAPRDLMFPKPTTFWQKEWALHSQQYQAQSSVHLNGKLLGSGLKHISDLRQRQMLDMERLSKIERDRSARQPGAIAEKDPEAEAAARAILESKRALEEQDFEGSP